MILKKVINEPELIKKMNLTLNQLDELRRSKNFPFVQVTKSCRMYFENSVEEWMRANEVNRGQ